jgi:hypothetical protein
MVEGVSTLTLLWVPDWKIIGIAGSWLCLAAMDLNVFLESARATCKCLLVRPDARHFAECRIER